MLNTVVLDGGVDGIRGEDPSPIVVMGRVIVTSSSGVNQDRLHVLAYDVETGEVLLEGVELIQEVYHSFEQVKVSDRSLIWNSDLVETLELRNLLDVAETIAEGSLQRRESRGAHQRLDYIERDDVNFLKHSLCFRQPDDRPRVEWSEVTITSSQPGTRDYSGGKK